MPRLKSLHDAGDRGVYSDLQWLYYFMEQSDPMIFSVIQRRRAAFLDCDWDIRRVASRRGADGEAVSDDGLAEEQAAYLREVYEGIDNFKEALGFLFTGFFRGFAHLEKHYGDDGEVVKLEAVEQWFWLREGMFGDWEYNQDAVSGRMHGIAIERGDFVVFESVPLNRMLSELYLRRAMGGGDWGSYLEVFGIRPLFLIGPPNATPAKELEYQAIAEAILSDGRGYLPNGADIKTVDGGGGKAPFADYLAYLDKMVALVGTGGILTMLAESGSGTLAGGAHEDSFQQIARGDAGVLSGVLQREVDTPMLAEAFPGWPVAAYFEFAPNDAGKAQKTAEDVEVLARAGYRVAADEVAEKTGYRVAAAPVVPVAPVMAGGV